MSKAIIVNTKGELLTSEVYYLVRIVGWEIEDEIVYPDLALDEDDFHWRHILIQIRIFYCLPITIIQEHSWYQKI